MPKESRTEKEQWVEESIIGNYHYKTTIKDGDKKTEGLAYSPEEAERIAKEKWDEEYGEDDDD